MSCNYLEVCVFEESTTYYSLYRLIIQKRPLAISPTIDSGYPWNFWGEDTASLSLSGQFLNYRGLPLSFSRVCNLLLSLNCSRSHLTICLLIGHEAFKICQFPISTQSQGRYIPVLHGVLWRARMQDTHSTYFLSIWGRRLKWCAFSQLLPRVIAAVSHLLLFVLSDPQRCKLCHFYQYSKWGEQKPAPWAASE